jgi:Flp pilus assembly protein TadG
VQTSRLWIAARKIVSRLLAGEASQIVEFAVSLPLLMVFVVAIGDFGGAITLKQKLNNAVREGARFGANEPTADLYSTPSAGNAPPSVNAIARTVGNYLVSARVNDCGLATGGWTVTSGSAPLAWQYTASSCPLTVTIQRGFAVPAGTSGPGNTPKWVVSTQVAISYPYTWQFNRVIGLIAPGANYAGPSQLQSDATVPNLM